MLKLVILEYGIYSRTSFVAGLVNRNSKRLKGLDETLISEETGDKYPVSNSNSLGPVSSKFLIDYRKLEQRRF